MLRKNVPVDYEIPTARRVRACGVHLEVAKQHVAFSCTIVFSNAHATF